MTTPDCNKNPEKSRKDDFYFSREWQIVRYAAIRRNSGRCDCCGNGRADGIQLHVDHIKPRSRFKHLELEVSNLQVLCVDCNLGKSNSDCIDWREGTPLSSNKLRKRYKKKAQKQANKMLRQHGVYNKPKPNKFIPKYIVRKAGTV